MAGSEVIPRQPSQVPAPIYPDIMQNRGRPFVVTQAPPSSPQGETPAPNSGAGDVDPALHNLLTDEDAQNVFRDLGEAGYVGYVMGRMTGDPQLQQFAHIPRPPKAQAEEGTPVASPTPSAQAAIPPPRAIRPDQQTPTPLPSPTRQAPAPQPAPAQQPPAPPSPTRARAADQDEAARELLQKDAVLSEAANNLARIIAERSMSHRAALLEDSRRNAVYPRALRWLGWAIAPTDKQDIGRAQEEEQRTTEATDRYNRALNEYVGAVNGDRTTRMNARLDKMNNFATRVQEQTLLLLQPRQRQSQARQLPSQNRPQAPQQSGAQAPRPYRPNFFVRHWSESRGWRIGMVAGATALAGLGVGAVVAVPLTVLAAPPVVAGGVGALSGILGRIMGSEMAKGMNRRRFAVPRVMTAQTQEAQQRNREYIEQFETHPDVDESNIDATMAYRDMMLHASRWAMNSKREAEKVGYTAWTLGFIAAQGVVNVIRGVVLPGGPQPGQATPSPSHAPSPSPAHSPTPAGTHTPTPAPTPTPTPTPGGPGSGPGAGINVNGWPWDVAHQLGSSNPIQSIQHAMDQFNTQFGTHYHFVHQPNGTEWIENMVNGTNVPLDPSQQMQFNQFMVNHFP